MEFNVWCIFASVLIVSAGAGRFDLGPQKFYESSSPAPRRDQNAADKEVVLYLTPSQIKALEAGGAVVRPADFENDPEEASEEAQPENEDQPEENAEQEQEQEQDDTENEAEQPEQQEEAEQQEQDQDIDEDLQSQDLALEEILRILNEEQIEQEEAAVEQGLNEPQVTEETSEEEKSEEERLIPPRFQAGQNQQQKQQKQQPQLQRQEKYLAPVAQNARSKVYAAIRYQRNEQPQRTVVQFPRQQQQEARQNQEQQEQPQTEAPALMKRYRLVPYQVDEQPEEPAQAQEQQVQEEQQAAQGQQQEAQQPEEEQRIEQQENEDRLRALLTPLVGPERLTEIINQRRNKLSQNELELQAILKELKESSKHNDQKYAIEIERLRTNLQNQNALAKAEAIAKIAPQLIRKEIQKRRPSPSAKLVKAPASTTRNLESQKQRALKPQPVPVEIAKPVPVPVVKTQKAEVARSASAGVEKRVTVPVTRNVYVKVNKPYLVERIVPVEINKEIPVEIPIRKPQRLTILRHIWEH